MPPLVKMSRSARRGQVGVENLGDRLAGFFQRRASLLARPMLAGGIGVGRKSEFGHRLHHFWPGRSRGVMVEVDRFHLVNCSESLDGLSRKLPLPQSPNAAIIPRSHIYGIDGRQRGQSHFRQPRLRCGPAKIGTVPAKEASAVMQRSATTAFRAFLMLACSVAIPVLAIWGISWADIAKKFQNFHCPAILNLASASPATPASASEAPPFTPGNLSAKSQLTPVVAPALPLAAAGTAKKVAAVATNYREIQDRLQRLGATYYVLESWGNDRQLYRFCCKMAVAGNADMSTASRPPMPIRCAMQQVLQQVETWREGQRCGG